MDETTGRKTVMIVEDIDGVRDVVYQWLQQAFPSVDVIAVKTAEDALARVWCHNLKLDVVLMDIGLPGMQGIEATRQIKKMSPATQVVMLTCKHGEENVRRSMEAGAMAYVLKDRAAMDLRKIMKRLLLPEAHQKNPMNGFPVVVEVHAPAVSAAEEASQ